MVPPKRIQNITLSLETKTIDGNYFSDRIFVVQRTVRL